MHAAERKERVRGVLRAQREDPVAVRMAHDDIECARADRAGSAEDGEVHERRSAAIGSTAVALSTRSRIPPWPGSSVPLSLTPAWRLAADSNRSPTMLIAPSSTATT